jgi:rSAM/selenodomain-associated transferase 1
MSTVAVAIVCKTPTAGQSKTRLSPPLRPEECAAISACFIRDLAGTVHSLAADGDVTPCAVYTPRGSEAELRRLLPGGFVLTPQVDGDFGTRLLQATADLLAAGHRGVLLVNSDSPTLPRSILRAAGDAVQGQDSVVLSPAFDGGYTLIGLSRPHRRLFTEIPWSTDAVCRVTRERAAELKLPVVEVPGWYDVDDAASLQMLEDEISGRRPAFAASEGADAPATRKFLRARQAAPAAAAV